MKKNVFLITAIIFLCFHAHLSAPIERTTKDALLAVASTVSLAFFAKGTCELINYTEEPFGGSQEEICKTTFNEETVISLLLKSIVIGLAIYEEFSDILDDSYF